MTRTALGVGLAVSVALVLASAATAATHHNPAVGRWEGHAGRARVAFTVEQTRSHRLYVVRPIVYCDPGNASWSETSPFNLFQPDAWPITSGGALSSNRGVFSSGPPFAGRFTHDSASLQMTSSTCAGHAVRFMAHSIPAAPVVADGSWNLALAPHDHGLIGEVTIMDTRGEGGVIDADLGVYDGGACFFERNGLDLLVNADGSFTGAINGNALATNLVTIHISGRFLSGGIASGSYALTGPGCTGASVAFTATFSSPYSLAPKPASGSGPFLPVVPGATDVNYVSLGDSYSAGHGVMPYDAGTNDARDKCHRSKYAYSRQLELPHFRLLRSFFACAGATTENVVSEHTAHVKSALQWPGERVVQLAHTRELSATDLVTITIGGNDVRFDRVLMACIRPANCNRYRVTDSAPVSGRAGILANTQALYPKLVETFTQLRATVPPTAAVLALDYPQLFGAGGLPVNCPPDAQLFTKDVQRFLRHAADLLDETEQSAARAAGVQFVDVRPIFDGHEICGRRGGWITHLLIRPTPGGTPVGEASVHPNRAGQAAYARAIRDYIDARIAAHAPLTPKGLPANPTPQP